MVTDVDMGPGGLQQALDGVQFMIRNFDGTICHWTRGMERLYGWPRQETLGRNVYELLRTVFPRPLADIEAQLNENGEWAGDLLNTRRNGEVIVAATHWSMPRAADDLLRMVVAVDSDVTQHRRAKDAQQYLADIVESSDDAIIGKTLGGIITSWNNAARIMFGYTFEEVVGQPISILFPLDRMNEEEMLVQQIMRGERVDHFETVRRRKDGTELPVSLTISPILDANGQIVGASKIARDITERKLAESKLQEVQSDLFHLSRLNTVSHMASGLTHELNQPLSAITNYLSGMQRLLVGRTDELSRTLRDALRNASAQSVRAGQIVRRLRDFMAHGEPDLRVEGIANLLDEASNLAFVGWKERGVNLRFNLHPDADSVLVDKIQIQQVLLNLLRNAVEAMEMVTRRELVIATTLVESDMVEISVADTGPGIDHNFAAQLFQPFATTKRHGMGVGLSISRTIIEAHGGRILAEPNPEGGTIFRFTVPLAPRVDEEV
jgi:two-component system, LuxR family, sensor kinase FixL